MISNCYFNWLILELILLNSRYSSDTGEAKRKKQAAFPKFLRSLSGAKTFKANLPVGGEGGDVLHARAHLGDWQDLALWVCNSLHVQHLS